MWSPHVEQINLRASRSGASATRSKCESRFCLRPTTLARLFGVQWSPLFMSTHSVEMTLHPSRAVAAPKTLSYTVIFQKRPISNDLVFTAKPSSTTQTVIQNPSRDVADEFVLLQEVVCRIGITNFKLVDDTGDIIHG